MLGFDCECHRVVVGKFGRLWADQLLGRADRAQERRFSRIAGARALERRKGGVDLPAPGLELASRGDPTRVGVLRGAHDSSIVGEVFSGSMFRT
jgi:hypothetical protein